MKIAGAIYCGEFVKVERLITAARFAELHAAEGELRRARRKLREQGRSLREIVKACEDVRTGRPIAGKEVALIVNAIAKRVTR